MKRMTQLLGLAALSAIVCLGTLDASAQAGAGGGQAGGQAGQGGQGGQGGGRQRGNRQQMDPAQMRQMRLDRVREQLEVTSDDDWKVIGDLAGAVIDAETALNADRSRGGGFGGRGGRNRGGNPDPNAPQQPQNNGGNRGGRFGTPSPELEALQKAIDDKAGPDEIKALLAKFQASHKSKLGKLATAEENLRKVLSVRQEGQAVLAGLMN